MEQRVVPVRDEASGVRQPVGLWLMVVCPACGQENPEGFRFCGACAAPLIGGPPPRQERKVITALFCDLVGSTAAGERLDPEDLQALLSRYHGRVRDELERFGGTVEKFIGDAVVALFGVPLAHEDDPERAVRAALGVKEWVGQQADLHVRMAVNTGEALVVVGARAARGEHLASGDVLNTAARVQAAAPVDGILVGEATFRATERVIAYREHESVDAKGKAEPVPVWEVVRARAGVGVDVEQPQGGVLVGRERELGLLAQAFERAREERQPQLVTLVGVPGIGKSRIIYELSRIVDADQELITWRQGRCLPYGDGVTFWALGEIVKAQAGILESDAPEEVGRKLHEAVEDRRLEAHLRPLVGLGAAEVSGGDQRAEAFAAWRQFFETLAAERPLVLVLEDLHWGDENLFDFLDHLVDWVSGVALLVVCSARPEFLERRPGWGGGKPNALTISLSPLSDEETARLIGRLVAQPLLAAETRSELLARAGGNPLYAEQYARILAERGELADLPETVQGIVAARLDLLEPEQKGLLQDAAVLGKTFWSPGLTAVSGLDRRSVEERLHGLVRRDFVRRERLSAVADDAQYAFLHVLIGEVAYAQLPRAERAAKHVRAAQWIESLGRPEDHAEMLAHHYLEAIELSDAAGLDTAPLLERLGLRSGRQATAPRRSMRPTRPSAFTTRPCVYGPRTIPSAPTCFTVARSRSATMSVAAIRSVSPRRGTLSWLSARTIAPPSWRCRSGRPSGSRGSARSQTSTARGRWRCSAMGRRRGRGRSCSPVPRRVPTSGAITGALSSSPARRVLRPSRSARRMASATRSTSWGRSVYCRETRAASSISSGAWSLPTRAVPSVSRAEWSTTSRSRIRCWAISSAASRPV